MDYIGQPAQSPDMSNSDLFSEALTAGVGIAHEKINDSGESLNSGAYRDNRNVGKIVLVSEQNRGPKNQEMPDHLGVIESQDGSFAQSMNPAEFINPAMPPGSEPDNSDQNTPKNIAEDVSRENDHISKKTLNAILKAENDFNKKHISLSEFYELKADARNAYARTYGEQAKWGKDVA
ncbi:hypothetical protein IKZ77_03130 [Candidatus Saccharibacteria bacterium]|nr:hypothetical protein [Candidatus Saccharibacteria bacterium]